MIDDVTAIPPAVEGEPGPAVPVLKPALVFLVTSPIPQLSRGPQILAAFEQKKLLALQKFQGIWDLCVGCKDQLFELYHSSLIVQLLVSVCDYAYLMDKLLNFPGIILEFDQEVHKNVWNFLL